MGHRHVFSPTVAAVVERHAYKERKGDDACCGNDVESVPECQIIGRVGAPALLRVMAVDDEEDGEGKGEYVQDRFFDDIVLERPEVWIPGPPRAIGDEEPYRGRRHAWAHGPDCEDEKDVRLESVDSDCDSCECHCQGMYHRQDYRGPRLPFIARRTGRNMTPDGIVA